MALRFFVVLTSMHTHTLTNVHTHSKGQGTVNINVAMTHDLATPVRANETVCMVLSGSYFPQKRSRNPVVNMTIKEMRSSRKNRC